MAEETANLSRFPQFHTDENMGYLFGEVDEWTGAAVEYIELLQGELAASGGFLHVHGWSAPAEKVQRGKELRAILGIKGSGE